jgi:hypothetical protein
MSSVITNDYEAFLFMRDHLLSQMEKAWDSGEDCVYRGYKSGTLEYIRELAQDENQASSYDEDEYDTFYEMLSNIPYDAKCAVGCLISDSLYEQHLEGNVIDKDNLVWDSVRKSNPAWKMTENSYNLMRSIQYIHDNKPVDEWSYLINQLEKNFDNYKDYKGECNV